MQVSIRGSYIVDKIEFRSNNILFYHDEVSQAFLPREFRDSPGFDASNPEKPISIFCYPSSDGVQIQVRPPNHIHLVESRSFEVEIRTGWNNISIGALYIRSCTAGLRIRLADVKIIDGDAEIHDKPQPGAIKLSGLDAESFVKLKVPYSLENDTNSLNFKMELAYTTDNG